MVTVRGIGVSICEGSTHCCGSGGCEGRHGNSNRGLGNVIGRGRGRGVSNHALRTRVDQSQTEYDHGVEVIGQKASHMHTIR